MVATRQNYFYSYDMIFKQNLTEHAKIVYLYLCRLADRDGRCYPGIENIAEACSIKSRTTIHQAIKDLINAGLLQKNNRKRICGGNTTNEYYIFSKPT